MQRKCFRAGLLLIMAAALTGCGTGRQLTRWGKASVDIDHDKK